MTMTTTPTVLLPADDVPSDAVIDALATDLRSLHELANLDLAIASGRLIADRLYEGDPESMHHRDPRRAGLRVLAEHPTIDVSFTTLYRYVAVYALTLRVQAIEAAHNLHYSHYRAVLSLPRTQQQPALERAATGNWTVAKLQEHIQQTRPAPRQRTPKPTAVAKIVADFERLQATHGDRMRAPDLTDDLNPDQASALADDLEPVIQALQALQARLREQAAADTPQRPAPEPAPSPTVAAPTRRPKPEPKPSPARPAPSRAPALARPSRPKPKPKPAPVTASTPNPIEAFENDASQGMRLVQALLARGVPEDQLAEAIERSTKAPAELARKLALLAKLPPRWQEGLLARSAAGRTRSLDDVLRAMKLL